MSKIGIYKTDKLDSNQLNEELKNQDNVYMLNNDYYQFQYKELSKEDELYINLKLLEELKNINNSTSTIRDDSSYTNLSQLDEIKEMKKSIDTIKGCLIFFTFLIIVYIVS